MSVCSISKRASLIATEVVLILFLEKIERSEFLSVRSSRASMTKCVLVLQKDFSGFIDSIV